MQIKFGDMSPIVVKNNKPTSNQKKDKAKDRKVHSDGLETNGFTRYDSNVEFVNIRAKVNVTRVKDDSDCGIGVAKGPLIAGVPVTVPRNDAGATAHAMKKRCDFKPECPSMEHFKVGHAMLMEKVPVMPTIVVTQDMFEEYIGQYTPDKAARLVAAIRADQLNYDGDTKHVFAKQEVLLKEHGSAPRVIYQGTDMYNAISGVIVCELNRRMKSVFSKTNPRNTGNVVLYACGMKNEEIGDAIESDGGVVVENDMKNNDGSQSAQFRKYEAMLYAKLGAPAWFVREFAKNLQVRVWTRYGIAGTVRGQMWSGVNNTTTGNSYVGMVLILASAKVADIECSTNIHGGDDYLGIVPAGKEEQFMQALKVVVPSVGMTPEPVLPKSREHATFYRKRYVRGVNGTRGVPQFGRVVAKLNLRANQNKEVSDQDYMAGKYLSAAYEHRYVPELRDYLRKMSHQMSERPHLDLNTNREIGLSSVSEINRRIDEVQPIDSESFQRFMYATYQMGVDELLDVYRRVGEGAIDYLDNWTYVDKRKKVVTKRGYNPPMIGGPSAEQLVKVDLGYA